MKTSICGRAAALALLALTACDRGRPTDPIVASAAGHELSVEEVVSLLSGEAYPNEVQVPYTVAELWVDYILLGMAVAEDATLSSLDVSRIVQQQAEQEMILTLRDQAVTPDTAVSEEEIQARFGQNSATRVRARHIFLATPEAATPMQRDSVRAAVASLRDRIQRGESFEQLARQFSQDPGTASEGGDLGFVARNELMGPLDAAAFALQPGQLSDIVESPFGLHILRVEERETSTLDDVREQVRSDILQQRVQAAESVLVAGVEEGAQVEVQPGAVPLVRQAAENPGMQLSRRARRRALVRYRGGSLTMDDIITFMQSRASQFRIEIYNAPDEAIEQNLLIGLAQRKLLATAAQERGIEVSAARRDSLTQQLRERLVIAAQELGLTTQPAGNDDGARNTRERHVETVLREMLKGTRDVTPLGSFSFILREEHGGQVFLPAVQLVVQRVQALRGSQPTGPQPPGLAPSPGVLPIDSPGGAAGSPTPP